MIACVVLGTLLTVLITIFIGVIRAAILLRRPSTTDWRKGIRIYYACAVMTILLPFSCCSGPGFLFRWYHGKPPLEYEHSVFVKEGMLIDQVRSLLGAPHEVRQQNGRLYWEYWYDSMETSSLLVEFGKDGHVTSVTKFR